MVRIKMGDPVTHREYAEFDPKHRIPPGHEDKAVVHVSFHSAMAYAAWLSRKTGRCFRLPLEEERKEAEETFVGDFSEHPLAEQPDVGAIGRNADGVADLAGSVFDWLAKPEDIADRVKLGWEDPAEEPDEEPRVESRVESAEEIRPTLPPGEVAQERVIASLQEQAEAARKRLANMEYWQQRLERIEAAIKALRALVEEV